MKKHLQEEINAYIESNITNINNLNKVLYQLSNLTDFLISINFSFNPKDINILISNPRIEESLEFITNSMEKEELMSMVGTNLFNKILAKYYNEEEYDKTDYYCNEDKTEDEDKDNNQKSSSEDFIITSYYGKLPNVLSKEEEIELLKKAHTGDKQAYNKLIEHNIRLVISIAKKHQNNGLDLLDLIQEGNIGLFKAIDRFDTTRGTKFSTYATYWINQSIIIAIQKTSRTIRLPKQKLDEIRRIKKINNEYFTKKGFYPSIKELANILKLDEEVIRNTLNIELRMTSSSLNSPVKEESDNELMEFVACDTTSPEDQVINNDLTEQIQELLCLAGLTEREKDIILRRNGFYGEVETLEEISKLLGLTRERVRQIEKIAINKLKRSRYTKELRIYISDNDTSKVRVRKNNI